MTLCFAASRSKPASPYTHGNTRWQQSCSHSNAICNRRFKKRIELRTQEHPLVAEHRGGTKMTAATPAAHTRYLSSPAAATLHWKTQGFVLRFPQHPCNIHAAITMRFAASRSKPASLYAHGNTRWQKSCSHSNASCNNHSLQNTEEEPKRPQPHPPHTQGTFHRRLYTENTRFRALASSPKRSPCNIHAAITMRFAASRSKPASLYTHVNTRWQQSCSHSNAICNNRFKKCIELRTQEHPLVAEHRGGTKTTAATHAAHTRYLSSPAAATLHGKSQGFVLRLPPQNKAHATFMQSLHCVSQHHVANLHLCTHMATPDHAAIPVPSATTDSINA